jgi:hypothetical protein
MYKKYQDELIKLLKDNLEGVGVKEYFGELDNPNEGKFLTNSIPCIYVDFVGDDTTNGIYHNLYFSLYLLNISFSKNEINKAKSKEDVLTLLADLYECIAYKKVIDSKPIILKKLRKIFDSATNKGYLTVYTKELIMDIPNPLLKKGK